MPSPTHASAESAMPAMRLGESNRNGTIANMYATNSPTMLMIMISTRSRRPEGMHARKIMPITAPATMIRSMAMM